MRKFCNVLLLSLLFITLGCNIKAISNTLESSETSIVNINENIKFDNFDLFRLADEIDRLEAEYKTKTIQALDKIGTTVPDGNITFDSLSNYIINSQKIKSGNLSATANNLPKNTACWVDGVYVIGTGKDIDVSYQNGYTAGEKAGYDRGV